MSDLNALGMSDADFLNADPTSFDIAPVVPEEPVEEPTEEVVIPEEEVVTPVEEVVVEVVEEDGEGVLPEGSTPPSEEENVPEVKVEEATYKAMVDKILAPFKANGKEMKVESIDDAIRLMQMGANYTKKMAALQPQLRVLKTLEKNDLLNEDKINYLIDLDKRNPEAINKLVSESGIDPLDIRTEDVGSYSPSNYAVSNDEMAIQEVLDRISDTDSFQKTISVMTTQLDEQSKQMLATNPSMIEVLNKHIADGVYDTVWGEVEKERMFGRLGNMSDLQAYIHMGNQMASKGTFNKQEPVPVRVPAEPRRDEEAIKRQKAAAAPRPNVRVVPKEEFNPLSMSDEEFLKLANSKYK